MSDFSLTLVLRLKTSKIINGMAKVQIKSERITPFGGIFQVRELFSRFVGPVIDKVLNPEPPEREPPGRVPVSSHAINHAFTDSCQSLQLTQ